MKDNKTPEQRTKKVQERLRQEAYLKSIRRK